mgnify:FL=1
MRSLTKIAVLAAALMLALVPMSMATQEAEHGQQAESPDAADTAQQQEPGEEAVADEHEEHGEHGGRHEHKNEIALFLGATDEHGHDTEFTYGLEYARRISSSFAVGGLVDYAGGGLRNLVLGVPVFWWPHVTDWGALKLLAAPGVEFHNGRNGGSPEHHKSEDGEHADEDETHFLFRIGAAYSFHLGQSFGIEPAVNLDFVNGEEVWVYGLNLTYGW